MNESYESSITQSIETGTIETSVMGTSDPSSSIENHFYLYCDGTDDKFVITRARVIGFLPIEANAFSHTVRVNVLTEYDNYRRTGFNNYVERNYGSDGSTGISPLLSED
ncbi:hypothetical protein SARC_07765 [Sphaeroforma arctica JP610]|uniref:Uncharacterized protein n=1 Tax=Sphaeroforma arctica JP610 TaxID=667725 RepID=A0A0L0FV91_9EUKA|nr:hypothetical protein SARC_07765 [Sphaeroforma arctica JP610]KNC79858.1 hypothetical protein SARC_07765 [Sphaeroforma arctica JP610]|eukprot:XP_014153760.1 hypothetical protein SARC_07765 [Sphaeroforma arctica JP610]